MLDLTVAGLTQINDSRAPVIQEYGIRPSHSPGAGLASLWILKLVEPSCQAANDGRQRNNRVSE